MPPLKAHSYIRSERRRYQRAQQGRAWSIKDLPQFYYHQNFQTMLDTVGRKHGHLLGKDELSFMTDFRALPHPAQCAYVRIAGRKGHIFNTDKLNYPEIENLAAQYDLLFEKGFTASVTRSIFPDYLAALPKPDICLLLSDHICETQFKKSWKKDRLIETALNGLDFDSLTLGENYIVQGRMETLNYLLYLYFGRIERSLQPATLNDLGLVKMADNTADKIAKYDEVSQAKAAYFYANALYQFKHGTDDDLTTLIDTVESWPKAPCPTSHRHQDKLLQELGGLSERAGDIPTALSFYERSDTPLCNERVVRLRYKLCETDWVTARLEDMIENPGSDIEHAFAEDFYARKFNKKRTSAVTDILREAKVIKLDEAFKNQPERAAQKHFTAKGLEVYRTENTPWRKLFGLLFWEELYPKGNSRSLPDSLKAGAFHIKYKDQIAHKLTKLEAEPQLVFLQLLQTLTKHYGAPNRIFRWQGRTLDRVKALLMHSPEGALSQIMQQMCENYAQMKDGYPDLMVLENGEVRFIEIKAEGDVLRRNQLTRIRQLRTAGYRVDVNRIDWIIDPDQIYVVVDVETTGGRPGLHRLTEIGAVKMQGGEIIDTWQSLLNPQRPIPGNITRLTGITNEMVAGAPLFHEIADSFTTFMGAAIFAAHNVNFDYGFISAEYEMIDRKFSHPKICTVRSMRQLYPGHRSYSLKNLCIDFQIDLTTHHRALCDAQAAAELLKLVNIKRLDS